MRECMILGLLEVVDDCFSYTITYMSKKHQ